MELGHFDKQSCTTRKRKALLGKVPVFFSWKRWPQSGHFFPQIKALLSDFLTRVGRPPPSLSNYVPASTACIYLCQQQEDRRSCEVCSKLTIKTLEWRYWCRPGVFIVDLRTDYIFLYVFASCYIFCVVLWIMQKVCMFLK